MSDAAIVPITEYSELSTAEKYELHAHEQIIERGQVTFIEVGNALLAIRDKRLYRATNKTFEEYCQGRWGMTHRRADQLIAASEVIANLGTTVPKSPENEAQVRELAKMLPEAQIAAWATAVETAPNKKVTANHMAVVARVFDEMLRTGAIDLGEGIAIATSDIVKAAITEETYERMMRQRGHIQENAERKNGKPKTNRAGDIYEPQGFDACQTPPYALDPLLAYLNPTWTIWEPAQGEGLLTEALWDGGFKNVTGTDILTGQNFFDYEPDRWDCLVTNPPYSIKYAWLKRCYELGKPFALLLPIETLGAKTAQELFKGFDVQVVLLDRRVNFKMPLMGYEGSGAQFPVAWFTWQLGLVRDMVFANVICGGAIGSQGY